MMPLYAMGTIACILFCGLTLDVGRMELIKVRMQNASDAAAIGAELASEQGKSGSSDWAANTNWVAEGQDDAAVNGFIDGQNDATVTVAQNPTSGPYAGRYDAIQATITQTFVPIFMGALNGGSWTLTTRSVALVPACTYYMGAASAQYTYAFQNASASLIATCPVYVNSGYLDDGFSKMWGMGIDVSGAPAASNPQGWTTQQTQIGWGGDPPSQSPTYGVPVIADPLLSYIPTQPSFNGTCTKTSYSITTGSTTLNPGNYCGTATTVGMTISNATVTLNPGLYIITGGASWTNATVTGTGVTLFFTRGNNANYGQMLATRTGNSICTLNLSAPLSNANGGIPGVLFFADRNWVSTAAMDFSFDTNTVFSGDGIWYLPNTGLYLWANSFNIPDYGGFVVRNTYFFGGSVGAGQDYSWLSGGSPFRTQSVLVQ